MRSKSLVSAGLVLACVALVAATPAFRSSTVTAGTGPTLESIGVITFGSNGVLYTADPAAATIYALEIAPAAGAVAGTVNVEGLDAKVAAMLGTAPAEISITDLAVEPKSKNSYIAVMRGQGAGAKPVLMTVDGAGKLAIVNLDAVKFTSVSLPNPANANPTARNNPRSQSIMDMVFQEGKLYVAGLSNEEFASKMWAVKYPFAQADRGTSIEIFHGNHGGLETRSPVFTFVPYNVGNEAHLIAGYLCTPLVKIPVASLAPGAKVIGTTIAELGAQNRPIDMIVYKKDGRDFLLMSNTARGVMKIGTDRFASEPGITSRIGGTAGVPYETIASMQGIQQMDLLSATHSIVISRAQSGALNLETVILP